MIMVILLEMMMTKVFLLLPSTIVPITMSMWEISFLFIFDIQLRECVKSVRSR